MQLLTKSIQAKLLKNGANPDKDHAPVVKFFTPDGAATWLISEISPQDPELLFGLCDLGVGCPELGYVRLPDLIAVRGGLGLPIERDMYFTPKGPMSAYVAAANRAGAITQV